MEEPAANALNSMMSTPKTLSQFTKLIGINLSRFCSND